MPFEIQYDSEEDCIFAVFIGKVTMQLTREYIAALLPILEETGCQRLLSDSRTAELQVSAMDIMQFPKMANASPLTANLKRAVLASPGTSGYELYETLCGIQGQRVKLFSSKKEALEWLMEDSD
ncbi:hypothetical protein [Pontiella sulfatireligans]|uniref:STAS/SEC14 domain-containing protein n=1 Tax=Pontiella sulfatireligans TaxID=2750658 RepID=A0A6C2UJ65_9BACT|nr:hypothetical protein [Pontiella sulfatireligans]VGO20260.1 hypothetical protein SCARR_02321 [Pontiella sulfatireligans]